MNIYLNTAPVPSEIAYLDWPTREVVDSPLFHEVMADPTLHVCHVCLQNEADAYGPAFDLPIRIGGDTIPLTLSVGALCPFCMAGLADRDDDN